MVEARNLLSILSGILVFSVAGRADMGAIDPAEIECPQVSRSSNEAKTHTAGFAGVLDHSSIPPFYLRASLYDTGIGEDVGQTPESQRPQIAVSGQNGINLYLSALLIGLGLCSSVFFLKKLQSRSVAQWCRNGGPFQIVHRIAVNLDHVCHVPACAFLQPVHVTESCVPRYHPGTIVSLWRKSQFTPSMLAPRGPPVFHRRMLLLTLAPWTSQPNYLLLDIVTGGSDLFCGLVRWSTK